MVTFVRSRFLRIYPALVVVVFLTVFVGAFVTVSPFSEYFHGQSGSEVYQYIYDNTIGIYHGVNYKLPNVFQGNVINANLWTLSYELQMYTLLGVTGGLLLVFVQTKASSQLFTIIWLIITAISMALYVISYTYQSDPIDVGFSYYYLRFAAMFGTGVLAYMLRNRIVLRDRYFIILLAVILVSTQSRGVFVAVTYSMLFYIVLYVSYFDMRKLARINKIGDYSYGVYIYGYPVQMLIKHLFPSISISSYIVVSFGVTMICAILSWELIEKRALRYKTLWQKS